MRDRPAPAEASGALGLTVFLPGQPGRTHRLEPGRRYAVGRSPEADLRIDDASVSRIHVVLEDSEEGWLAVDQVSKNGTRFDGRPVDRLVLSSRGWLEIGGVPLRVEPGATMPNQVDGNDGRTDAVSSHPEPLDHAVHELARLSGCERSGIWLVSDQRRPKLLAQLGEFDPGPSMTVIGRAAVTGRSDFCSDTEGARALARSESIASGGIRAYIAMPIVRGGKVLAVAYADSLTPGRVFTQHDADLLEAVTGQIGLFLESERIRRSIHSLRRDR